jgi:hypothetical protein
MFEPIKVKSTDPGIEEKRIPAFVIEHEDKEDEVFTVPEKIDGGTAMLALEVIVTQGEDAGVLWLAKHALGDEGMNAVLNSKQLSVEQASDLLGKIGQHYTGQVTSLGKGSANGSSK